MRRTVGGIAVVACAVLAIGGRWAWAQPGALTAVKACAGKGGVLAVEVKGKCPTGTKAVSIGTKGARGPAGPAGPSTVYTASKKDPTGPAVAVAGSGYVHLLSIKVPAGTYLATQSVEFLHGAGESFCYFGPTTVTKGDIFTAANMSDTDDVTSSADGVVSFKSTKTLVLLCTGGTGATVQRATITALRVGSVHAAA